MKVIVATPEPVCIAHRALTQEAVEHEERIVEGDFGYGELITELWEAGDPFVLIEWDIVPWPGAVQEIIDCERPRCVFRYPLTPGRLAIAMGMGKYVPKGAAHPMWSTLHWRELDGRVIPYLNQKLGPPCYHEPAVAHARVRTIDR